MNKEHWSVVIVGTGSIAEKHLVNVKSYFESVNVGCLSASGRELASGLIEKDKYYLTVKEAIQHRPDFVIIATTAETHIQYLAEFIKDDIPVLVEKPLSSRVGDYSQVKDVIFDKRHLIEVGYNLRYMESANFVKKLVSDNEIGQLVSVQVDVGQYLPDWRPGRDYTQTASAKKSKGGGALLELSHELDYVFWIFGRPNRAFAIVRNSGVLEIDVEDVVDIHFEYASGTVLSVHLDFIKRKPSRTCRITTGTHSIEWNLLERSVYATSADDKQSVVLFSSEAEEIKESYIDELRSMEDIVLRQSSPTVCVDDAMYILEVIEKLRYSSNNECWVELNTL